jgi:hypothetical protein
MAYTHQTTYKEKGGRKDEKKAKGREGKGLAWRPEPFYWASLETSGQMETQWKRSRTATKYSNQIIGSIIHRTNENYETDRGCLTFEQILI